MHKNQIIAILVCLPLFISLFFLFRVLYRDLTFLESSSPLRLNIFILIHIFIMFMMIWFTVLEQTYDYVVWSFTLSLVISCLISFAEFMVYLNRKSRIYKGPTFASPLEMGYLNCYFLIYMYSLITLFLTATFIILTKCFQAIQEKRLRYAISQNVHPIDFTEQMREIDCPICLNPICEKKLVEIQCKHIFHEHCLFEWLKINQTCPNCRFNIFEQRQQINQIFQND